MLLISKDNTLLLIVYQIYEKWEPFATRDDVVERLWVRIKGIDSKADIKYLLLIAQPGWWHKWALL